MHWVRWVIPVALDEGNPLHRSMVDTEINEDAIANLRHVVRRKLVILPSDMCAFATVEHRDSEWRNGVTRVPNHFRNPRGLALILHEAKRLAVFTAESLCASQWSFRVGHDLMLHARACKSQSRDDSESSPNAACGSTIRRLLAAAIFTTSIHRSPSVTSMLVFMVLLHSARK